MDNRLPVEAIVFTDAGTRSWNFESRNAQDHPHLTAEFHPTTIPELFSFPIRRRAQCVQAAGGSTDQTTQTLFNYPRHATSQYEARQFNQQEIEHHLSSTNFLAFLTKASLRVERVLVENNLFNPFNDHVIRLQSASDGERGNRTRTAAIGESTYRPARSVHAARGPRRLMHYSELCEGMFVSAIHCHPTFQGIIAAGYAAKVKFEDKQAHRDRNRGHGRHFVLIWNTNKLMEPTLILEAADDILAVKFNTQQPYIIAASCLSGMIAVWDLAPYSNYIKPQRGKWCIRPAGTPVMVPTSATLENYPMNSKRIEWAPSSVEFSAKGPSGVTGGSKCAHQLFSAYDGFMTVWDAKMPDEAIIPSNPPIPHLPTRVRPVFKVFPEVRDKRRDVAITCFAMTDHSEKRPQARIAEAVVYPPICIAGTEEGEIFIMDWRHYIEIERGASCTATLCVAYHDGPVVDILPSPHISNTVLSIGGHIWAIWKSLDLDGPILELPARPDTIQSGAWSPWQSSVIAIGLSDGLVEIWDILASTSRPQRQVRISQSAITTLGFNRDQDGTFLAIADADGSGKITLLPFHTDALCPDLKELRRIETFIEEEVKHRHAMSQLINAPPPAPHQDLPDQPLVYTNDQQYFEDFKNLESKILLDISNS